MGFLLFILLIIFTLIGWPLLRGWLYMQSIKKRVNDVFGDRQQTRQQRRAHEYEQDDTDGKIYDSSDGEYAEFEDLRGTTVEQPATTSTIVEEQVIDAEFEDIRE